MKELDQDNLLIWSEAIGDLPKGFFLEVKESSLFLNYRGPGYKDIIQPGGRKPRQGQEYAFICMHSIVNCEKDSVISYILEHVGRTQEKLSG